MEKKFIEIFNLYKNDIYRLAFSYTKNVSDSDDIVQNVFIKLYKRPILLEQEKIKIKKWLVKVTINECKTLLLSSWKKKITSLMEKDDRSEEIFLEGNQLLSTIMSLSKKYRVVIYLYYYEGYKVKEISKLLKISETNVQTRLSRAREKLKVILKEDFDYER